MGFRNDYILYIIMGFGATHSKIEENYIKVNFFNGHPSENQMVRDMGEQFFVSDSQKIFNRQ